jgi:iron complex outermembrane recepter protein
MIMIRINGFPTKGIAMLLNARAPSVKTHFTTGKLLAGLALTALMADAAYAEEEADTASDSTIIVTAAHQEASTASKTGTASRDVPASIQSVPIEIVQEQGALALNEVVRNVSGVQPIYGGGYGYADNYVIRGLRMKFLRDGVADGPTFVGYARSFSDVERVEVLKGPGSSIYGRSEPGGIINIITKQPEFTPLANVSLSVGSRNSYNVQGDVGVPLSQSLAVRATGEYSTSDGIRGLSKEIATGSVALLWNLSDRHRITAKGEIYAQDFVVDNYGIPAGFNGRILPVDYKTRYYTPDNHVGQDIRRFTLGYSGELTDKLSLRATYRVDSRDLNFRRNAGFTLNGSGQISSTSQRYQSDESSFQIGQVEAVYESDIAGIKGKTLIGFEHQRDRFDTVRREYTFTNLQNILSPTPRANAAGLAAKLIYDRSLKADTDSLYFQHEAAVGEMIKIRAGYRLDWAKYSDVGISTATPVAGNAGPLNRQFNERLESGQFGAVFQPTKTLSLYGGYATGQFVNIQTESTALTGEPESSKQIEAGLKWDIIPNRLNLNVAAFKIKRRNYNITLIPGAAPVPLGAQDAKGFEVDLNGNLTDSLHILANYAYLDAKNVSREVATTFAGTSSVRTGSIFGLEPAAASRHSGSVWLTYDLPAGRQGLSFGAGMTAKGRTFADAINAIRVPGYTIGNAAIFWRQPHYEITLNIKNVTNKRYFENPTFAGGLPGDPRTVLLTIKAKI